MLVAIHGFTENDLTWCEVLNGLRLDTHCPLLPGHGHRPCPRDTTVSSVAKEIAERHRAKAPFDVLGYSMGGRIGLTLALEQPSLIKRLILISSGPGFRDEALQGSRRRTDEVMAEILEEDGLGPFVAWWETNPILKPYKPLKRSVEEDLRSRRLDQDPLALAGALRRLGAGAMPNFWDRLKDVRCPTLLVAGSADKRYVGVMKDMATLIPKASYLEIPEAGHAIHREQPEKIRQLVSDHLT